MKPAAEEEADIAAFPAYNVRLAVARNSGHMLAAAQIAHAAGLQRSVAVRIRPVVVAARHNRVQEQPPLEAAEWCKSLAAVP